MNKTLKQLRWKCRRGMLELDIILSAFLEKNSVLLSDSEQQHFEKMLGYPDPLLHAWLLGYETPHDINDSNVVKKIRTILKSK